MADWKSKIVPYLIMFIGFLVIGAFTGWVVGASRSPIANAVIPVAVGLLGAISFSLFERKNLFDSFLKAVEEQEKAGSLTAGTHAKVRAAIGGPAEVSFWPPALWSVGVMTFCLACFVGILWGVSYRIPTYTEVDKLLGATAATPENMVELHRFEYHCKAANVPRADYENVFKTAIIPTLTIPISDEEVRKDRFPRTEKEVTDAERQAVRQKKLTRLIDDLIKAVWKEGAQPIPVI